MQSWRQAAIPAEAADQSVGFFEERVDVFNERLSAGQKYFNGLREVIDVQAGFAGKDGGTFQN